MHIGPSSKTRRRKHAAMETQICSKKHPANIHGQSRDWLLSSGAMCLHGSMHAGAEKEKHALGFCSLFLPGFPCFWGHGRPTSGFHPPACLTLFGCIHGVGSIQGSMPVIRGYCILARNKRAPRFTLWGLIFQFHFLNSQRLNASACTID